MSKGRNVGAGSTNDEGNGPEYLWHNPRVGGGTGQDGTEAQNQESGGRHEPEWFHGRMVQTGRQTVKWTSHPALRQCQGGHRLQQLQQPAELEQPQRLAVEAR